MSNAPPTLAFVHGGFCDASDWDGVIAALNGAYAVIVEDLPGHGAAPLPPGTSSNWTIEMLASAVRRSIGNAERVVLVGHSLGCTVALEAARSADNIAGLVLIEGGMGAHHDPARTRHALEAHMDAVGMTTFLGRLPETWFSDETHRTQARERVARIDQDFARALLLDAVRWDGEDAVACLQSIDAPLLAVQTTRAGPEARTPLVEGDTTPWLDLIAREAPQARMRVLAGMGHFPHVEHSDSVSAVIQSFAAELALS